MNLMTLVRLLVLLVIGWTVVALGAGVLGVGRTWFCRVDVLHCPVHRSRTPCPLGRLEIPATAEYRLVDQTTGQTQVADASRATKPGRY